VALAKAKPHGVCKATITVAQTHKATGTRSAGACFFTGGQRPRPPHHRF
jgi:hypothetical protein